MAPLLMNTLHMTPYLILAKLIKNMTTEGHFVKRHSTDVTQILLEDLLEMSQIGFIDCLHWMDVTPYQVFYAIF